MTAIRQPFTFSTPEADSLLIDFIDSQKAVEGNRWGKLTTLAQNAPPPYDGQVGLVHACSGEGKSTFRSWWLREEAKRIRSAGIEGVLLSVMLEESLETDRSRTLPSPLNIADVISGKISRNQALDMIAEGASDPIMYIGAAMNGDLIHPDASSFYGLSPVELANAVTELRDKKGIPILGIALDYLQLMRDNANSSEAVTRVSQASEQIERLAKSVFKCPFTALAQSDLKKVKASPDKQPRKEDIQWSSRIAQDASWILSLWMPAVDIPLLAIKEIKGVPVPIFKDMLIVDVNKWRGAIGLTGEKFVISMGNPFGDLYELSLESLRRCAQNVDRLRAMKIQYSYDVPREIYM